MQDNIGDKNKYYINYCMQIWGEPKPWCSIIEITAFKTKLINTGSTRKKNALSDSVSPTLP